MIIITKVIQFSSLLIKIEVYINQPGFPSVCRHWNLPKIKPLRYWFRQTKALDLEKNNI